MVSVVSNHYLFVIECSSNVLVLANCGKSEKYGLRNVKKRMSVQSEV